MVIAALWTSAGKGLTSWLSFVMLYCVFVTFTFGILGQGWCLIVSIPDICPFYYREDEFLNILPNKENTVSVFRVTGLNIFGTYAG